MVGGREEERETLLPFRCWGSGDGGRGGALFRRRCPKAREFSIMPSVFCCCCMAAEIPKQGAKERTLQTQEPVGLVVAGVFFFPFPQPTRIRQFNKEGDEAPVLSKNHPRPKVRGDRKWKKEIRKGNFN